MVRDVDRTGRSVIQLVNSRFGHGWWADAGQIPVTVGALIVTRRTVESGKRG